MLRRHLWLVPCVLLAASTLGAQPLDSEYDESAVAGWELDEALPSSFVDPATVEANLERQMEAGKLPFCEDPAYVLHVDERPLCPLAEAARPRCPEFVTACARPSELDRRGAPPRFGRGGKQREPESPREEREPLELSLPAWLGGVFRVLFWVVVGLLIAAGIYLLANAWGQARRERDSGDEDEGEAPAGDLPRSPRELVESDVTRLLARAKLHAAQGRHPQAVDDLYAALLRHLEGQHLLVIEPHRTNGDHIRSLRGHPDWQRLVAECGRDVERSQFGKQAADAPVFVRLLQRIEPALTRAMALFMVALVGLGQSSCSDGTAPAERRREWGALGDPGADGLLLFVELLKDAGHTIHHRIRRTSDLDEEVGMLVVYDSTSLEDEDWKGLERWVSEGHRLWIAGDAEAAKHFGALPSADRCNGPVALTDAFMGPRSITRSDGSERPLQLSSAGQTLAPREELTPLFECGDPLVQRRIVGNGLVVLFADATALSNASLASTDNAVALMSMVDSVPMTVEFAGGLTGAGAESPYQALFDAKLGPLLLQLALLMLVWYLSRGIPFARLRDPADPGRRRFLDHLGALGRIFQKANARQYSLHHYSAWALAKLNERIRPGQRASVIELGTALAKRTGRTPAEVLEILAEAANARQAEAPPTGDELAVQKSLETLVIETGGAK